MSTEQATHRKTNKPLRAGALVVGLVAAYMSIVAVILIIHLSPEGLFFAVIAAALIFATRFLWKQGTAQAKAETAAVIAEAVATQPAVTKPAANSADAALPPFTRKEKTAGVGAVLVSFAIGAVVAIVALVGGSALENHYRLLDGLCNGAEQEGLANSTNDNVHCGIDTALYSIGNLLHVIAIVVLIAGGLGFVALLAIVPKIRQDLKRVGRW
jgi:hypothetical protein